MTAIEASASPSTFRIGTASSPASRVLGPRARSPAPASPRGLPGLRGSSELVLLHPRQIAFDLCLRQKCKHGKAGGAVMELHAAADRRRIDNFVDAEHGRYRERVPAERHGEGGRLLARACDIAQIVQRRAADRETGEQRLGQSFGVVGKHITRRHRMLGDVAALLERMDAAVRRRDRQLQPVGDLDRAWRLRRGRHELEDVEDPVR